MTRDDYNRVAEAIRRTIPPVPGASMDYTDIGRRVVAESLVEAFAAADPNFKADRFLANAGIT